MIKPRTAKLLSFLMILSICSVGFSSWTITNEQDVFEVESNVKVDPAVDASDYILLDKDYGLNNSGIYHFSYSERGFVSETDNTKTSLIGYIRAYYSLNLKDTRLLYPNEDTVDIKVRLGYTKDIGEAFNIFYALNETSGSTTFTHEIKSNSEANLDITFTSSNPTQEEIKASKEYTTTITFNNLLSTYDQDRTSDYYKFVIEYKMEVTETQNKYFLNNIYPKFKDLDEKGLLSFSLRTAFHEMGGEL